METKPNTLQADNKPQDQKKIKTLTVVLTVFIIALVALIGIMAWLIYDLSQEKDKSAELESEKIELIEQFQNLSAEYEYLKTDNDSMNNMLNLKQEEIQKLITELNRTRANNAAVINQYKKELGTLRDVLKSYIVQVDSLNQANIALREENIQARDRITRVETQLQEEIKIKEDLSAKVQMGSMIVAEAIEAAPINQRGRDVNRIGRVDKIKVCFTLKRNAIASPGERTVFLRIIRPDNLVLTSSADNLFMVENEPLVYSASRNAIYENVDIDMCIFWTNDGSLISGNYTAEIYMDGALLGTAGFSLR
jgi:Tfp pilus assembly protein PilO